MPLYEYRCKNCNHRFEKIQKFSDSLVRDCPECGKPAVEQLVSAPAVQFKGTGWYVTDYARKGSKDPSAPAQNSDSGSGKKAESSAPSSTASESSAPADKPSGGTESPASRSKEKKK